MKLGSSLVIGLRATSLSPKERKFLIQQEVAGVILFKRNLKNFQQIHQLCKEIKSLGEHSPWIGIDMEGGRVNRFSHIENSFPWPSASELSLKKERDILASAKALGEMLAALGFDINFAPVVDLAHEESSLLKTRTFGSTAEDITTKALCFIEGLKQGGVEACLKHFPGHGGVSQDSHKLLPKDLRSLQDLEPQLEIFETLFNKEDVCIMTAHIEFPNIENLPASFSKLLLTEELKNKRGFKGLVISDDITMLALKEFSNFEKIKKTLQAGCDLVLHCSGELDFLEEFESFAEDLQKDLAPCLENSLEKRQAFKARRKELFPLKSWSEASKKIVS